MYTKQCLAIGMLAGVLCSTSALGNQASTEYVKASIDTLRNELNNQFSTQFNELNNKENQLTIKTNELTTTTNQLMNTVSQLMIQLNALTAQTNEASTTINNKIELVQNQVSDLPIVTHHIGEIFQGGVVFYVDKTQQHGLMVSLDDLGHGIEWRNGEGGDRTVNAKAQGLGAGETNTRLIIAQQTIDQQEGQFAALVAANYQILADGKSPCATTITADSACYGGWYLPSVYELMLLNTNLKGQLSDTAYWSSTEASTTEAWLVDFRSGEAQISEKSTSAHVRAIHAF